MKFGTKAIHVGCKPDEKTGAVISPIYLTSTFAQEAPGEHQGYDYTRAGNPNFTMLEEQLASLENGKYATVFSSGLGALTGYLSSLSAGDKVFAMDGLYGGTYRLFDKVFKKLGIVYESIPASEIQNLEKILSKRPKCFLFETPTNPLLEVYDIAKLTQIAKDYGVTTIIDNTFATPYFQNPLDLGADIVWHSCTKYIGGHSDIIGGVMITNDLAIKEELDFARKAVGLNPSPFDSWMVSRSVKTLHLRMEQHQKNAFVIANFLLEHPLVKRVYYPGLVSDPNHAIAKKQMSGFSGIISAEFNLSLEETKKLIASFKLFTLAESLGGVESLVNHPATMTHASIPKEERTRIGLSDGLVRFSVGVEEAEDLVADLKHALARFQTVVI